MNQKSKKTNNDSINILLDAQEEFLISKYSEMDSLWSENRRLNDEVARLTRTIMMNNNYINYLLNSFWWKITIPFRFVSRKLKHQKTEKYNFIEKLPLDKSSKPIDEKISIVIFTYNPGEEFAVQLDNIKSQKMLNDIEIVIFDRGSRDNTEQYAKDYNCKFVSVGDKNVSDYDIYKMSFSDINGDYVVLIDQNKVIDSKYWIYYSIRPIRDNKATVTAFLNKSVKEIGETSFYENLKKRMPIVSGEQMLFLPHDRNIIQYITNVVLDKTTVLVRKKEI